MKATTRSPQIRRVVARAHGRAQCPICRKYSRFNDETLAAFREADEDDRYFAETGKHLPGVGVAQTLEEFLMKLRDLVRRLDDEGYVFVRHGANHDWYRNVITGAMGAVPRHREIEERLARSIIRKLSAPKDGE